MTSHLGLIFQLIDFIQNIPYKGYMIRVVFVNVSHPDSYAMIVGMVALDDS
jgi:hypothetical protein